MGLLDSVIGGVVGQVLGQGRGGAMSPIVKALLMLLLAKGAGGGLGGGLGGALGDVLGGGRNRPPPGPDTERSGGAGPYGRDPGHAADDGVGDIGGYDQDGGRRDGSLPGGDYSDLSGMLDGPGDRDTGPAREIAPRETSGLDDLIHGFQRGGLSDVIGSWIGNGANRAIAPHDLARALGPDTLDTLQGKTGLDRDTLLNQLAQVLPEVVNGLTPQGRVPDAGERHHW